MKLTDEMFLKDTYIYCETKGKIIELFLKLDRLGYLPNKNETYLDIVRRDGFYAEGNNCFEILSKDMMSVTNLGYCKNSNFIIIDYKLDREVNENDKFKSLNDIESNYVVKLRNGNLYKVGRYNQNEFNKALINKYLKEPILFAYEGLKHTISKFNDIVAIYGLADDIQFIDDITTCHRSLLWEETEYIDMTIEEIEKFVGYRVKVLAKE